MGEWSAPWSVKVGRNGAFSVVNSDDYPVCRIVYWTPSGDKKVANLIAAAPDLYEALAKLTEVCEKQPRINQRLPEPDSPLGRARAALAKARGEAE